MTSATDNAGWNKYVLMWDWHTLCRTGWPRWDIDPCTKEPYVVCFSTTKGRDKSSRDIAIEFDDLASGRFYYRDYTDDTLPFVRDGEVYNSSFWFENQQDLELFKSTFNK